MGDRRFLLLFCFLLYRCSANPIEIVDKSSGISFFISSLIDGLMTRPLLLADPAENRSLPADAGRSASHVDDVNNKGETAGSTGPLSFLIDSPSEIVGNADSLAPVLPLRRARSRGWRFGGFPSEFQSLQQQYDGQQASNLGTNYGRGPSTGWNFGSSGGSGGCELTW